MDKLLIYPGLLKGLLYIIVFSGFLSLTASAYNIEGNGICNCNGCSDCNSALNDNGNCSSEVKLTASIIEYGGTCINNPANFSKKIFDCQGYAIDGDDYGTVFEPDYGLYLSGKSNNTIRNCVITDFYYGVYLHSSSNNTLTNNTANSNGDVGFYFLSLKYSTLTNNIANSSHYGFLLSSSSNNTLINNTANSNGDAGIFLSSSKGNTIANNTANSNYDGIYLLDSSNSNIIANNIVNSNDYGFSLGFSSNNTLTGNTANSNTLGGFLLYSTSYNTLITNTANLNNYGFVLNPASNNTLTNNIANSNTYYGFYLGSSSPRNILTNNTANSNTEGGIYLSSSNSNTIVGNTANLNKKYGIRFYSSSYNTLISNTANSNNVSGIYSYGSSNGINSSIVCDNINYDFQSSDWLSSSGDENSCNNPNGWNDAGTTGCTYVCSAGTTTTTTSTTTTTTTTTSTTSTTSTSTTTITTTTSTTSTTTSTSSTLTTSTTTTSSTTSTTPTTSTSTTTSSTTSTTSSTSTTSTTTTSLTTTTTTTTTTTSTTTISTTTTTIGTTTTSSTTTTLGTTTTTLPVTTTSTTTTITGTTTSTTTTTSTITTTTTVPTPRIVINEFLPYPRGNNPEWIELYNKENYSVNLSGWHLDDMADGGSNPYTILNDGVITAGGFKVFYGGVTGIVLGDMGDTVRLLYNNDQSIDSYSYSYSQRGVSIGRLTDGGNEWTNFDVPTLGISNEVGLNDNSPPVVTLGFPSNEAINRDGNIIFKYTPNDWSPISNCMLYTNVTGIWQISQIDTTVLANSPNSFGLFGLSSGTYQWNVRCTDEMSLSAFAPQSFTFAVNITTNETVYMPLNITVNQTVNITSKASKVTIEINVTENISNVNVIISSFYNNTHNASLSVPGLDKYVSIISSSELEESLNLISLKMYYTESELIANNLTEDDLGIWWFDETGNKWQLLDPDTMDWVRAAGVNKGENYVWTNVEHFSDYTIAQGTAPSFCLLKGDTDCDAMVSDFELLGYINKWVEGLVEDFDVLTAIDNWAKS